MSIRKGGSVASNSVVSLVNNSTYESMNQSADNYVGGKSKCRSKGGCKKGGSVASNAVVSLVDPADFSEMNSNFDNIVGGKTKTSKPKRTKPSKPSKQKGGETSIWTQVMDQFSSHFIDKHTSGGCGCGKSKLGGFVKKGGNASALASAKPVGLDYSAIKTSPSTAGHLVHEPRGNYDLITNSSISGNSYTPLAKVVQYGNTSGTNNIGLPFTYGGSRKKKVSFKKHVKKQVPKKK